MWTTYNVRTPRLRYPKNVLNKICPRASNDKKIILLEHSANEMDWWHISINKFIFLCFQTVLKLMISKDLVHCCILLSTLHLLTVPITELLCVYQMSWWLWINEYRMVDNLIQLLLLYISLGSQGSCVEKFAGYRIVLCAESSVSCIGRFYEWTQCFMLLYLKCTCIYDYKYFIIYGLE